MGEEQKEEEAKEEEPPEIVLKVDMHCEGCARKDVKTDCKSRTVVIKGKAADPARICERIQKKTGKKVELISPLPKPPEEEEKKEEAEAAPEETKEEPKPITVVLKVRMHCERCARVLQKRIKKMDGVESVATDLASGQVVVTGFIDPVKLAENVHRRTRKQASIVPEEKEEEGEKKDDDGDAEKKQQEEEEKNEEDGISEYEYWPSRDYVGYAHTPQTFSDENPNACFVM
ncbi:Heavy metal-associated domain containing protein [Musa troglodytarum]|uniref:Heavy metal-associated domain containing protein n=1 Tax=Musa troglodytarum TaxID=320322 RepID=A0A9E7EG32_9LILI|nr:Heavy metal-associated domain containing protein [Musa troglodytarum]